MIINIKKSILFTVDPDIRFAQEYNLPQGILKELYRRHTLRDFTIAELCEFYQMKTMQTIGKKSMRRWMWRTKIYSMTLPIIAKGGETVVSSFFKEHEWRVIKEISKNLQSSVRQDTKTLI